MVVSASVASVRMRREFGDIETASCLLLCATCMHRVHHVQCGAAGVIGLLIAALTALTHADLLPPVRSRGRWLGNLRCSRVAYHKSRSYLEQFCLYGVNLSKP